MTIFKGRDGSKSHHCKMKSGYISLIGAERRQVDVAKSRSLERKLSIVSPRRTKRESIWDIERARSADDFCRHARMAFAAGRYPDLHEARDCRSIYCDADILVWCSSPNPSTVKDARSPINSASRQAGGSGRDKMDLPERASLEVFKRN